MIREAAPGRGGGEGVRTRDHLANVRTLLAFLRTGLVLTGMGLVIGKLEVIEHLRGFLYGFPVAAIGCLLTGAALARFLAQRRAIERDALRSHVAWDLALLGLIGMAALLVMLWLGGV